jgi:hypothetical protein
MSVSGGHPVTSEDHAPIMRMQKTPEVKAYLKEVREMRRLKEQFLEAEKAREKP